MRASGGRSCGGRLRRFYRSGLLDGSAVMEQPRNEKDGGEDDSSDDAERKIIGFRQQGRPLEMGLNEVVARPCGRASDRDGLRMDRRLGGREWSWPRNFRFCGG